MVANFQGSVVQIRRRETPNFEVRGLSPTHSKSFFYSRRVSTFSFLTFSFLLLPRMGLLNAVSPMFQFRSIAKYLLLFCSVVFWFILKISPIVF